MKLLWTRSPDDDDAKSEEKEEDDGEGRGDGGGEGKSSCLGGFVVVRLLVTFS